MLNTITTADSLTPFNTGTNLAESPFTVGGDHPTAAAITPDARTAWVLLPAPDANTDASIVPVDLTQRPPAVGAPVTLPGAISNTVCTVNNVEFQDGAGNIALNPAGTIAYVAEFVTDSVYPVDLTQNPAAVGTPIVLPAGSHPDGLAVSTDGAWLYVADQGTDKVTVISTMSNSVSSTIALATGAEPNAIAMIPDGTKAYVSEGGLGKLLPITLPADTLGTPITVGAGPNGAVATPDGTRVYVTSGGSGPCPNISPDNTVTPVTTSTASPGTAITMTGPVGPAVTPDGATVYVPQGVAGTSTEVVPIDAQTNLPATAFNAGDWPRQVVIAPDQAPVASFTVQAGAAGQATTFDASGSSVAVGSITAYHWDFGDGAQATTSTVTTSHVYAAAGAYTATLTETDSAGTSTTRAFGGQQVLRNGGPAASTSRTVSVAAPLFFANPAPNLLLQLQPAGPFTSTTLSTLLAPQSMLAQDMSACVRSGASATACRACMIRPSCHVQWRLSVAPVVASSLWEIQTTGIALLGPHPRPIRIPRGYACVSGESVVSAGQTLPSSCLLVPHISCPTGVYTKPIVCSARATAPATIVRGSATCTGGHRCVLLAHPTAYGRRLLARGRKFNLTLTTTLTIPGTARRLIVRQTYPIPVPGTGRRPK